MRANLLIIDLKNFDVILGMDWLMKCKVFIDCYRNTIIFHPIEDQSSAEHVTILVPIISMMKARKLLNKECNRYLATVVDTTMQVRMNPEVILVVRELLGVFSDNL